METQTFPKEECTPNGMRKFTTYKDGNGGEHRIVNFDNPEAVKNKGTVIVEALKKSTRQQPSATFSRFKDRETEINYGIPSGINAKTKEIQWQPIEINDVRVFDLSIRQDRVEWAVIQMAPYLVGSPNARYKPTHKVKDVEADAEVRIKTVSARVEANKIAVGLSEIQIIDMARNVGGIDTKHNSPLLIRADLLEYADKKPLDFLKTWHDSNRSVMTVFKRCMEFGLIHFDVNNGGFIWKKTTVLGATEPSAINYVGKHEALLMSMDSLSKSMDDKFEKLATDKEKSEFIAPAIQHKGVDDDIMGQMKKELDSVRLKSAELDRILEKAKKAESVELNTENKSENVSVDEDKLKHLRESAARLGMKHTHLIKDVAKLEDYIRENTK